MKTCIKITCLSLFLFVLGCSKDENEEPVVVKSDAKALTSFVFNAGNNAALSDNVTATVTEAGKSIAASVPNGTDVTALTPTIQVSAKASVSPTGAQDFNSPITYTITAEDGSTVKYTASVIILASDAKQILSFAFTADANDALSEDIVGEIDETERKIVLSVSSSKDITALLPTIEVSENASINPSDAQDFTEPVTYTVTAEDGSTVEYEVSVEIFVSQKEVLIAIFNANSNNSLSWILADDISTWEGVQVNSDGMVTNLNIRSKRIGVLPIEIGYLTELSVLDLSSNVLTSIPESTGQLTNLVQLYLFGNKLTSFPNSIFQLINLENLGLGSNELTNVPLEIGELTNLKTLDLQSNLLTSIPISIGQLTNLTSLQLSRNQLTNLPTQLKQLTNLLTLEIGNNPLSTIIDLSTLINLRTLSLSNLELRSIPDWVFNCKNLSFLSLVNNNITTVPNKISELNSMSDLHFRNNQITVLPEELWQLTNLTRLSLNENRITVLSNKIENLTKMRSLYISDNQINELPNEITNLSQMSLLYMHRNNITNLSSEVCEWLDTINNVLKDDTVVCEN